MKVASYLVAVAAIFTTCRAIISQPLGCSSSPKSCYPRVITSCPRKDYNDTECSTCCCDSSKNVEFYNPDHPEPWCSAPPAVYTVRFVGTWTAACQPDYYPSNAHWSPPTGASHNTGYQMWDACMDNVSPGVALVSQTGSTSRIEEEYRGNSSHILDTFRGTVINGGGSTSSELSVDKYHQWVSAVTMLAPSRDRMVGVANLRLCDGTDWKKTVKVCSELFSTATKSERVHPAMHRNSVQWNNCSFGYFTFTFKEYQNSTQQPPSDCQRQADDVCPAQRPQKCSTCCCQSSNNVDFYHPGSAFIPECASTECTTYKVSLIPNINEVCHANYQFVGGSAADSFFSGLLLTSGRQRQTFDSCGVTNANILNYLTRNRMEFPPMPHVYEGAVRVGALHDFYHELDSFVRVPQKRRTGVIDLSPTSRFLNIYAKLLPSGPDNQWLGVSGLNLCGPNGWKDHVEVCLSLFANPNTSLVPGVEMKIQGNHCSFARAVIERQNLCSKTITLPTCSPNVDLRYYGTSNLNNCCSLDFIIDGQILSYVPRSEDPAYSYDLMVQVSSVHYDDINYIQVGDVVTIKVCNLPLRIKFRRTYRLAGFRECGSNDLEISENGLFILLPKSGIIEEPCASYISGGNCDDPR